MRSQRAGNLYDEIPPRLLNTEEKGTANYFISVVVVAVVEVGDQ